MRSPSVAVLGRPVLDVVHRMLEVFVNGLVDNLGHLVRSLVRVQKGRGNSDRACPVRVIVREVVRETLNFVERPRKLGRAIRDDVVDGARRALIVTDGADQIEVHKRLADDGRVHHCANRHILKAAIPIHVDARVCLLGHADVANLRRRRTLRVQNCESMELGMSLVVRIYECSNLALDSGFVEVAERVAVDHVASGQVVVSVESEKSAKDALEVQLQSGVGNRLRPRRKVKGFRCELDHLMVKRRDHRSRRPARLQPALVAHVNANRHDANFEEPLRVNAFGEPHAPAELREHLVRELVDDLA
eukprot:Opistho-1_new@16288